MVPTEVGFVISASDMPISPSISTTRSWSSSLSSGIPTRSSIGLATGFLKCSLCRSSSGIIYFFAWLRFGFRFRFGLGVGFTVGFGLGVGVGLGFGVGVGLGLGVGVGFSVGSGFVVGFTVGVGITISLGGGVTTGSGSGVGAGVGTGVGSGVGSTVGSGVGSAIFLSGSEAGSSWALAAAARPPPSSHITSSGFGGLGRAIPMQKSTVMTITWSIATMMTFRQKTRSFCMTLKGHSFSGLVTTPTFVIWAR